MTYLYDFEAVRLLLIHFLYINQPTSCRLFSSVVTSNVNETPHSLMFVGFYGLIMPGTPHTFQGNDDVLFMLQMSAGLKSTWQRGLAAIVDLLFTAKDDHRLEEFCSATNWSR